MLEITWLLHSDSGTKTTINLEMIKLPDGKIRANLQQKFTTFPCLLQISLGSTWFSRAMLDRLLKSESSVNSRNLGHLEILWFILGWIVTFIVIVIHTSSTRQDFFSVQFIMNFIWTWHLNRSFIGQWHHFKCITRISSWSILQAVPKFASTCECQWTWIYVCGILMWLTPWNHMQPGQCPVDWVFISVHKMDSLPYSSGRL